MRLAAAVASPRVPDHPVVLVTGAAHGIGLAAVRHLRDAGCTVVASARRPDDVARLRRDERVDAIPLDVTDPAQREAAIAHVLATHGRLDGLVNNAGYGATLAQEDVSLEAMRAMYETNVFAPHELVRLALPAMRRQGFGRIVNVASIAGHVAVPMMGTYCATKFALRAATQALATEVHGFGVRAILVEPGVIRTGFGAAATRQRDAALTDPAASPYAPLYAHWARRRMLDKGADAAVVARAITHACTARRPRFHYFVPWDSKSYNVLKRVLPDAALNWGYRRYFAT